MDRNRPRSYDVYYGWSTSDNNMNIDIPRNSFAALGCAILTN